MSLTVRQGASRSDPSWSRASRHRSRSRITKDHILQVTEQAIFKFGMARITTRRVADIAGVAEGTIFRYFPSKNELVLAALRRHGAGETAFPGAELAGTATVRDNLATIIAASLNHYARVMPSVIAATADSDLLPKYRKWFLRQSSTYETLTRAITAYVSRERKLGRIIPSADPELVAETILSHCIRHALGDVLRVPSRALPRGRNFAASLSDRLTAAITPNGRARPGARARSR